MNGLEDIYIIKVNSKGNLVWERQIENIDSKERAHSIKNMPDGGYIIIGNKWEFIAEAEDSYPGLYLVRLDSSGKKVFEKVISAAGK